MKANEAPEKIYLYTEGHTLDNDWLYEAPEEFTSFEYIRTDAFIEKACEFVKSNIDHYIGHYLNDDDTYLDDSFIEDFKKYMK